MANESQEPDYRKESIDEACKQVGRFFFSWAILESSIDSVIHDLFKLEEGARHIITANLRFLDKLYIVQTALRRQATNDEHQKRINKLVRRIGKMNRSRNLLAHNMFVSLNNGNVRFFKVEAKGALEFPRIQWSKTDFKRTESLINAVHSELEDLTKAIKNRRAIIEALIANPQPTPGSFLQALAGLPNRPIESLLDSEPASPETSPQSPQRTEEK
jgi:hypothetical protein